MSADQRPVGWSEAGSALPRRPAWTRYRLPLRLRVSMGGNRPHDRWPGGRSGVVGLDRATGRRGPTCGRGPLPGPHRGPEHTRLVATLALPPTGDLDHDAGRDDGRAVPLLELSYYWLTAIL